MSEHDADEEPPDDWKEPGKPLQEDDYAPWREPGKPEEKANPPSEKLDDAIRDRHRD